MDLCVNNSLSKLIEKFDSIGKKVQELPSEHTTLKEETVAFKGDLTNLHKDIESEKKVEYSRGFFAARNKSAEEEKESDKSYNKPFSGVDHNQYHYGDMPGSS